MIEALVSAAIAAIAAGAALNSRTHNRINDLDRRIDTFELRVATNYVPKQEFTTAIKKIEDHMIRIENKIDQIVLRNG
jgi:septal ring factor EnvC (AmiA/AmiB activator)